MLCQCSSWSCVILCLSYLQYEKAASILSRHDPPVVLAKVDASDKTNKDLSGKYDVQGFPTIKILRNQGENVQEYNGPRDADGIVEYLKKQVGPASVEKSAEDYDRAAELKYLINRNRYHLNTSVVLA